jgi:branched-chain amino acid transport system substrate-binding protein
MRKSLIVAGAMLALTAGPAMAQSKSVKIGFISTFSGPTAVIGNDMRNSFELALDHLGRKMAGLPIELFYEDDQQKPEVGLQKTQKLVQSNKVDFVVGYIWSNVLLASYKPVIDSQTFLTAPMLARRRSRVNCARPGFSPPRGRTTRRRRPWAST